MARQRIEYEELVLKLSQRRHISWQKLIDNGFDLRELRKVAQLKDDFSLATKTHAAAERLYKE